MAAREKSFPGCIVADQAAARIHGPLAGVDHGLHALRLDAREDTLQVRFPVAGCRDWIDRVDGDSRRRSRIGFTAQMLREPFGDLLRKRGNRQKGIHAQR